MSLKTWAGFRSNAHGVIRPTGRSGCRRAPGPPESWRDWPPRRGSARRLRLHVAEHRLQAEQAGIAQVRSSSRRRMPARISMPRSAAQGLLQPGTAGGALAPTVEALPLMVCRVAALPWTSPRRAGVRAGRRGPACPNEAPQHLDCRRNARRYRASTSSPASAAVAGAPLAPLLPMTEQKHTRRSLSIGFAMVVHARRLRGRPARRWRSWP